MAVINAMFKLCVAHIGQKDAILPLPQRLPRTFMVLAMTCILYV